MCGIAGILEPISTVTQGSLCSSAAAMSSCLYHRGPDDRGVWCDAEAGIALAHRRLSIVDLSSEGHQPMVSPSGRYILVYNGEVYNHAALRSELERQGSTFHGHSDTEVVLAAIESWGLKAAILKFNGMFAIAVWDRREQQLSLVRDRVGIKPLYYGRVGSSFVFGSELKALRMHPGFNNSIDRNALALYMKYAYVPAPFSIFAGISKLMPGQILEVESRGHTVTDQSTMYWSARDVAEAGLANPFSGTADDAVQVLEDQLRDAIRLRMVADVPVGAFLSGGYDSSLVVALMQLESDRPVRTFTIGSFDAGYDEASNARAVANHLGTDHTELYVSAGDAMEVIPRLPVLYDEPFADSSQIPTFLVSQLAREQVTVSLSGDGGDELFAGYNRHLWAPRVWEKVRRIPVGVRSAAATSALSVAPRAWDHAFERMGFMLPRKLRVRTPGDKVHKLAGVLAAGAPDSMYNLLVSQWTDPSSFVLGTDALPPARAALNCRRTPPAFTEQMMYWDLVGYLPDDILTKVDRASMGVSLEARVPLLDHRLVELAWQFPLNLKLRDGGGKWILRQVLQRYVPSKLVDRPKAGFGLPIGDWLRGPLRGWTEELLDEERLRSEGYFDPEPIRRKWREHLSGDRSWQHQLWTVLMFQAWLEHE